MIVKPIIVHWDPHNWASSSKTAICLYVSMQAANVNFLYSVTYPLVVIHINCK